MLPEFYAVYVGEESRMSVFTSTALDCRSLTTCAQEFEKSFQGSAVCEIQGKKERVIVDTGD